MLLRLSGIDTYYGQIHILSGLDMEVGEGELVCLLGGNASGKSTTLKTILGIVEPRNGAVEFAGENVTERNTSYRIRLGMAIVPENRRLFAPMTVRENLEMGAYLRGRGGEGGLRPRLHALPAVARAAQSARRDDVRRRAADGRDGARADVPAEAAADGRAVHGARADPGRAELRDHQGGARGRASRSWSSSRTRTSRSRSPTAATSCRPAASCSRARRKSCSSTKT